MATSRSAQRLQQQAKLSDISTACRLRCSGWTAAREKGASQADGFAAVKRLRGSRLKVSGATQAVEKGHITQPGRTAAEK